MPWKLSWANPGLSGRTQSGRLSYEPPWYDQNAGAAAAGAADNTRRWLVHLSMRRSAPASFV
jgi:hypothetical protein